MKLIGYLASSVTTVSPYPCFGPSTRIKICLFLLLICADELISAPKRKLFFPFVDENSERESNPMPQPLYMHLSGPAFLVRFTDPNKSFFNVKFVL